MVGQSWGCAWKVNAGSDCVIIYELITHTHTHIYIYIYIYIDCVIIYELITHTHIYIYISFNLIYALSLLQTKKHSVQP